MATKKQNKGKARKQTEGRVYEDDTWIVNFGRLVPPPGRPHGTKSLFRHVGEKLPYECLDEVRKLFKARDWDSEGVYIAHDSMGFARYVGRGQVFNRLKARHKQQPLELAYFSFYVVANKNHEREIETVLIRLGGAHLQFNERKKRIDITAGAVKDYEAGTRYLQRQRRRGRKPREAR